MNRSELAFGTLTQFVILAMLALTAADADLWGHLTFGSDIVTSGHIVQIDRYSFTSDVPWINHEWLAELAMAVAWRLGAASGLILLKLVLFWIAGVSVLAAWRPARLEPMWRDGLLFVVALGVWPLAATIRPQAFSIALFAILLLLLVRLRAGREIAAVFVPVVFAIWVNTHGGWLVGAGVLAIFTAFSLVDRQLSARRKIRTILMTIASAAACVVNPYGLRMLGFLATTVRPGREEIIEWLPVTALPPAAMALWLIPVAVVLAAFLRQRGRAPRWAWAVTIVLGVASFRVARLGGFFALAAGLLLAPLIAPARQPIGQPPSRGWPVPILSFLAIGLALMASGRRISMDGAWVPEPGVAEFMRTHELHGRLFTWFDYGEYAIWHLNPALRVSMDGRRETVYSQRVRDEHWEVYRNGPDAVVALADIRPDFVWLPKTLPVVSRLVSAGWHPLYVGPRSVVLGLQLTEPVRDDRPVQPRREFPGP